MKVQNKINEYLYAGGFVGGLVNCGTAAMPKACTYANFIELLGRLFTYLLILAVPLSILGIGIGALFIITGAASESNRTKGKEILFDSIIGLVLAAGAWLIVNAVIVGLGAEGFVNPLK